MSAALDAALEHLTSTYQSLAQAAEGYRHLDAQEVAERLAKAKKDTSEYIALEQLAKLIGAPKKAKKNADSTDQF